MAKRKTTQKSKPRKKAKAKASSATKRARPVELRVDASLKKAWRSAHSAVSAASREGMHAFDRKYEAVGEIINHDPPLYLAGGVATVGAFVAKYLPGEDVRSVLRNVRVAQYGSPDEENKYGTSKIDAAIDYLEAKNGAPAHGRIPVDFAKLRIPVRGNAHAKSVLFADATVQQIHDATRALGAPSKKSKPSPVVVAIQKLVPKQAKQMTVHFAGGYVSLSRIPVEDFATVLRALAKAEIPKS
jgi:hypothetical protein